MDRGEAVIFLADEDLARVISLLLRDAGFQVHRATSLSDLESASARMGVSLVVVAGERQYARCAARSAGFDPPPDREYRLVALVRGRARRRGTAAPTTSFACPSTRNLYSGDPAPARSSFAC